MRTFQLFLFIALLSVFASACNKDDDDAMIEPVDNTTGNTDFLYSTGLDPNGDLTTTPINASFGFGNSTLPSQVDLTPFFPPVGDQGSYGTCVAWAVGYNFKSAINAIDRNLSSADLQDTRNQGSPRYLFTSVPDAEKGANCDGMLFDPAFNILQQKGLASQADVPYTNLGNCSQQLADPSWDQTAGNNKIENYRRIDGSIDAIKRSLHDKMPVVLGAKLGQAFQEWTGDGVLNTTGTFDPNFQHAYHAMVILGYDDAKGANGAFRVVNSWTDRWGDSGFIWIDYAFMMSEMLMRDNANNAFLYVATNTRGQNPDDNQPNPPSNSGGELLTWMFDEVEDPNSSSARDRVATYDIYNFGNGTVSANQNWDIYYVYYNAYNINDWGVLFHNQLTTSVQGAECHDSGCLVNADIPAQSSLGMSLFGAETIDQNYTIPNLNGQYFLMLVADGEEEIAEHDEADNYFFPSLTPINFSNGVITFDGNPNQNGLQGSDRQLLTGNQVDQQRLMTREILPERPAGNAYRLAEIKKLVEHERITGGLAAAAKKATASTLTRSVTNQNR